MQIVVVSDIHANAAALGAVLDDAGPVEALWCLGDTVGYGPEPEACVRTVWDRGGLVVAGNHDAAAIGKLDPIAFNPLAAAACRWTTTQLSSEVATYLDGLPTVAVEGEFTLAHGSPRDPLWEYVLHDRVAAECFQHFTTTYCLVGHTHVPYVYRERGDRAEGRYAEAGSTLELDGKQRAILNPGSVGQPRDDDPRAAYLLLDFDNRIATWRRVAYDLAVTQRAMAEAGLPEPLIRRLAAGW